MTEAELITALHRENVKQEHIEHMLSLIGDHPALRVQHLAILQRVIESVHGKPNAPAKPCRLCAKAQLVTRYDDSEGWPTSPKPYTVWECEYQTRKECGPERALWEPWAPSCTFSCGHMQHCHPQVERNCFTNQESRRRSEQ